MLGRSDNRARSLLKCGVHPSVLSYPLKFVAATADDSLVIDHINVLTLKTENRKLETGKQIGRLKTRSEN